jgi:catabolite regulation protein CreA
VILVLSSEIPKGHRPGDHCNHQFQFGSIRATLELIARSTDDIQIEYTDDDHVNNVHCHLRE